MEQIKGYVVRTEHLVEYKLGYKSLIVSYMFIYIGAKDSSFICCPGAKCCCVIVVMLHVAYHCSL